MKIKAVLFDLGNTLVYSHPEKTFQRILAEHGIVKSVEEVKQALIQGNKEFDIDSRVGLSAHLSAHEFYTQWNLVQLKHLGVKGPEARRLAQEIDTIWFKYAEFRLYPDVRRTITKLKKIGLKLGIITGGYVADIEQILPRVGLDRFFDVCVGADTVRKRKPHTKAFRHALRQLGVKPEEAVFVGDNLEADYVGAKRAGMTPILIRRKGPPEQRLFTDACLQPSSDVRSIQRLDEIFELLREISS